MSKFDPERDPPIFAVISRTPPPGVDAGQFLDTAERFIGRAAAEPGFLGIEELTDEDGSDYTACYWDRPSALAKWKSNLSDHVPPKLSVEKIVIFEGCLWHWLSDVFDAVSRARSGNGTSNVAQIKAA